MNKIDEINEILTNDVLEKSVLSCIINRPDCFYETEIKEEYFYNYENKKVFQVIKKLIIKEKTVDTSMLIWEMWAVKWEYILELSVYILWVSWFHDYVDKLKDYYKLRKVKSLLWWVELINVESINESIDTIYKEVGDLMNNWVKEKTIEESINYVLENAGKTTARIWYFGYPEIDSRTFWIKPWKFTILMARPAVGKTLTAVNIASKLMDQQVKSMILSGEMLSEEVVQRFLSIRYWIKPYIFESKSWIEILEMIWKSWKDDFWFIPEYIKVSDNPLIDYMIYQSIYWAYHREWIKVFIIDYLQIATWTWKQQNKAMEIWAISAKIKRMCNELKIHVIGLAQISREGAKSWKMSLEYLKDSWNLEQDADIVIWLEKDENEKWDLIAIDMTILKNRWGWGLWSFSYLTNGWEITNKLRKYTK